MQRESQLVPKARVNRILHQLDPALVAAAEIVAITKKDGVAILTINNPPVNSFGPQVRDGLIAAYDAVDKDSSVKAIVITGGGKGFFMAGADIPNLKTMIYGDMKTLRKFSDEGNGIYNRIESGAKPTVAAVNGVALGGGCELAMACNARIGVKKTVLGLPELNLGLIPGLGGTQRLPRLIGVKAAIDATLKGKQLKAKDALKAGLLDHIVDDKVLLQTACQAALAIAAGQQPRRKSLYLTHKIGDLEKEKLVIEGAKLNALQKMKNVPHPFAFLRAVEAGLVNGGEKGIAAEADEFGKLLHSRSADALLHVFLSSKACSKVPGVDMKLARPIRKVAVIGGGTMGAGIALVYLMKGCEVILKEVNEKFLGLAVERIADSVNRFLKMRKMPSLGIEQIMRGLTPQITYDGFNKCDLVVEAVLEKLDLKQKIFKELEAVCNPNCILATNTSSIDIELIGSACPKSQDRILGLHFFSPAHIMPLLEIVRTKFTSAQTLATSVEMGKKIGKTVCVVGNCPGFTANRVFAPYGQAANLLADSGVNPYVLDKAVEDFGMPMGPFKMSDLAGVDIGLHVGKILTDAFPQYAYKSGLPEALVKQGRLGQKTGAGYYKYVKNKPVEDLKFLSEAIKSAHQGQAKLKLTGKETAQDLLEMVMFPVVNECCRVISEGHVIRESDVDMCSITGYAFPNWRGGVMKWARAQEGGIKRVAERLNYFSKTLSGGDPTLKAFFAPCDFLLKQK